MLSSVLFALIFTILINWAVSLQVTIPTIKDKKIKNRLIIFVYLIVFFAGLIIVI
jgi:hypothetical protein